MKHRHSFYAKPQMYKKRLSKWGIRKNYSKEQKLSAIEAVSHGKKPLAINNKPVVVSRLRRPVQQHGKLLRLTPAILKAERQKTVDSDKLSAAEYDQQFLSSCPQAHSPHAVGRDHDDAAKHIPRVQLQQSPEAYRTELVFINAGRYFDWYFAQTAFKRRLDFEDSIAAVVYPVSGAQGVLATDKELAFQMLDRACAVAKLMLELQPYQMLVAIAKATRPEQWRKYDDIRVALLQYLSAMAARILGVNHPIANMVRVLSHESTRAMVSIGLTRLSINVATQRIESSNIQQLLAYQVSAADDMVEMGEFEQAEMMINAVSAEVQKNEVGLRWLMLVITDARGNLARRRGNLEGARREWTTCLELALEQKEPAFEGEVAGQLADLHRLVGDVEGSQTYARVALECTVGFWGPRNATTARHFVVLLDVLTDLGKFTERRQLREQYANICDYWAV